MERDPESDDRASRGRRIFEALRKRTEGALSPTETATTTAVEEMPASPDAIPGDGADRQPSLESGLDVEGSPSELEPELEPERASQPQAPAAPPTSPTTPPVSTSAPSSPAATPTPTPASASQEHPAVEAEPDDEAPTSEEPPPRPLPGVAALESQLVTPPPPVMTPPPVTEPVVSPAPPEVAEEPEPVAQPAPPHAQEVQAEGPAPTRPLLPLPRVIAVANQKGGVGKTTTAVNLGAALAELDYRVLVVDLDPQGNATTGMGIDIRNLDTTVYEALMTDTPLEDCIEATSVRNLFVAPSNMGLAGAEIELVPMFSRELKLRRAIEGIKADYDVILIDCPPSLGLLTVNGLASAEDVIVPIQCEYYALEGLGQLVNNVGLVRANLNPLLEIRGIVLTMYDARTNLADQVVTEVRRHFGDKVFQSVVPRTVRLSEAPSFGQPIIVFDPHSRGSSAYRGLARELASWVEGGPERLRAADVQDEVSSSD